MKCPHCKSSELYNTYETFRFDSKRYTNNICPECDHEEFIEIIPAPRKRNPKLDMVALSITSVVITLVTIFTLLNLDKLSTIN